MTKKGIRILIVLAIAAVVIGIITLSGPDDRMTPRKGTTTAPASKDYTYISDEYNFSVTVPAGWSIYETSDGPSDVITLYKNIGLAAPQSYIDDSTHVSILPAGSETGGILPWQRQAATASPAQASTTEFVLRDGTVWAKKLEFSPVPDSWQSWGFVYASAEIDDLSERCIREGREIPIRECDPFSGAIIERDGTISSSDLASIERILGSFTILN